MMCNETSDSNFGLAEKLSGHAGDHCPQRGLRQIPGILLSYPQ